MNLPIQHWESQGPSTSTSTPPLNVSQNRNHHPEEAVRCPLLSNRSSNNPTRSNSRNQSSRRAISSTNFLITIPRGQAPTNLQRPNTQRDSTSKLHQQVRPGRLGVHGHQHHRSTGVDVFPSSLARRREPTLLVFCGSIDAANFASTVNTTSSCSAADTGIDKHSESRRQFLEQILQRLEALEENKPIDSNPGRPMSPAEILSPEQQAQLPDTPLLPTEGLPKPWACVQPADW